MDFDFDELKTLKRKRGVGVWHLRSWLCLFMKAHHATTRRWPKTKLLASLFGFHPRALRQLHLDPMVKQGYLKRSPPPYTSLTRYSVVKDHPYEPPRPESTSDAFEEGNEPW